ncbi:MAG: ATPase [Treponema sp.]|jgi:vacuolar-type H+-ATPase subunit E/Vma4|nr:ATPase [Treponema sp.]
MEELQSTEVLDREILEDARKKAFRIIKNADDAIKDAALSWERKMQSALVELRRRYAEKTQRDGDDIMGRLMQDKRRVRSVKIEALLKKAASDYLSSLDRKQLLALLEHELFKRLEALEADGASIAKEDEPEVMPRIITEPEAEKILENAFFKKSKKKKFWTIVKPDVMFLSAGTFPALIVNAKKVKVTASIDDAEAFLLEDKRAELTAALLGDAVLGGVA